MNFPFRKNSPACRIPSNSRKTFWLVLPAGSRNFFRYHATPVGRSWMLTLKARIFVPGVRQGDTLPTRIVEGRRLGSVWITDQEFPIGIEVVFGSRAQRSIDWSGRAGESRWRNAGERQNQADKNYQPLQR